MSDVIKNALYRQRRTCSKSFSKVFKKDDTASQLHHSASRGKNVKRYVHNVAPRIL